MEYKIIKVKVDDGFGLSDVQSYLNKGFSIDRVDKGKTFLAKCTVFIYVLKREKIQSESNER